MAADFVVPALGAALPEAGAVGVAGFFATVLAGDFAAGVDIVFAEEVLGEALGAAAFAAFAGAGDCGVFDVLAAAFLAAGCDAVRAGVFVFFGAAVLRGDALAASLVADCVDRAGLTGAGAAFF